MRSHLSRWVVLVWAGIWLASNAAAQAPDTSYNRGTSLIDQLDQFGRSLFGGLRGPSKHQASPSPAPPPSARQYGSAPYVPPRAGSGLRPDAQAVMPSNTGTSAPAYQGYSAPMAGAGTRFHVQQAPTIPSGPPSGSGVSARSMPSQSPRSTGSSEASRPGSLRLHERLSLFRESTFEPKETSTGTTSPPSPAGGPSSKATAQPSGAASSDQANGLRQPSLTGQSVRPPAGKPALPQPAYTRQFERRPSIGETVLNGSLSPQATPAPRTTGTPTLAPSQPGEGPTRASAKAQPTVAPRVAAQPALSQPSASSSEAPAAADESAPSRSAPSPTPAPPPKVASSTGAPAADPPEAPTSAANESRPAPAAPANDALFSRQSPVLNVRTLGPRRIMVGKESSYEVIIHNSGQMAADEVVVTVGLPDWADVAGAEASSGETRTTADPQAPKELVWEIARLESKAQEKLVLRIVPRQSRAFDLAVRWDYTPAVTQAMIEVQEPKLEMRLEGPREVLFGKQEIYRLELANTGTGDAEGVEITLAPIGTGQNAPATHRLGDLAAGDKKVVEIELTARQSGALTIQVDAHSETGATAQLSETIAVLQARLDVAVDAPPMQFVGNEVAYRLRVANLGTAPASDVALTARLPLGTKYVSSTDGKPDAEGSQVTWTLESLPPGAEQVFDLVGRLERAGPNRLEVSAAAADGLTASAEATTQVEAIADLRLDVVDPTGPVAVGANATYEIEVQNRGSKGAEEVEVVAYFSRGVEPVAVEGGPHKIAPGQVVFDKIPLLAAGEGVLMKIHAKAETAGNHVFRAEVYCKPLSTRLVSEETTHYYQGPDVAPRERSLQAGERIPTSGPNASEALRRPMFGPLN